MNIVKATLRMQLQEKHGSTWNQVSSDLGTRTRYCKHHDHLAKQNVSKICFVLHNGTKVFPAQMGRRDTGNIAFRVSPGDTGGNTLEASLDVDEETMVNKVLRDGWAVRCKSVDGKTNGLYKHGHRSVSEVILEL